MNNETTTDNLNLDDPDRLPWLETAEDYREYGEDNGNRKLLLGLLGLALLAAIVGGLWWYFNNLGGANGDGALIAAQEGDYKVRPKDDQAREFDGVGDASFAASEGKEQPSRVAKPGETEAAVQPQAAGNGAAAGGAMVQLGAFGNAAGADAAWSGYARRFAQLSGLPKKIVAGQGPDGTVYRLNAVAGDARKAQQICNAIKAAGENCLVVK